MTQLFRVILISTLSFGCLTPKKAEKKAARLLEKQPAVMAQVTRDNFPCVTTRDTVISVITDDTLWLEIVRELQHDLWIAYNTQDSLKNVLSLDTNCSHYAESVEDLKNENIILSNKLKNIPPVIKTVEKIRTVEDKAITEPLRSQVEFLTQKLAAREELIKELEGITAAEKGLKRSWRSRALWTWFLLVVGLAGGLLLKRWLKFQ